MSNPSNTSNPPTHKNAPSSPLPIVIAGGGCVGLFLALLLTQSAIPNPILVIEPHAPSPNETRAMAHQPPIFPLFAKAGLMPELQSLGTMSTGICFRKSVRYGSELIAGKKFGEGEVGQLLLPQWKFQECLVRRVRQGKGEVRVGWRVVGFVDHSSCSPDPQSVTVTIQSSSGQEEAIEAAYLIGADGGRSTIRTLLSIPFDGETLDSQLVATDIRFPFDKHGFYDANFVIDDQEYGLISKIDDDGLWRVSYGVPGEMSHEEIVRTVREKLDRKVPGKEKGYEVVRVAPYRAQQRCAETFWRGRVGLVGDAAHLTNPYAGLGLASGIADAHDLALVLARILSSPSSPSLNSSTSSTTSNPSHPSSPSAKTLLNSWSSARRQKFLTVVDAPSRAAFIRVRSDVSTDEKLKEFLERDPLVRALRGGMPMPIGRGPGVGLSVDVEGLDGWGSL
ncbi:hypothetical protein BCR34DRAFT_665692 [Clohesyomyces aquaticus]|uniref:FAD-binding domain-containing protein n=1 Tax=Clohesyomyces aquaticus TaxID=1231657 RepID=A0A1Y1ZFU1_9PLEO|nr:hypothetical protein BCR34DRAFT_665692 [Clohesyomyces aquaticus]